jgi:hypothetical protein
MVARPAAKALGAELQDLDLLAQRVVPHSLPTRVKGR